MPCFFTSRTEAFVPAADQEGAALDCPDEMAQTLVRFVL